MRILHDVPGISFVQMTQSDIVRHRLVTRIVEAYEREDRHKREDALRPTPAVETP